MMHHRSIPLLLKVHPDLQRVIHRLAEIYEGDFVVTEGERTLEKQKTLFAKGLSKTMKSRHIPESNACGVACAVDLAAWVDLDGDGSIDNGEIRWDWPLYADLGKAVKEAARLEGVPIEWGGDWAKFRDGPHFQLPWKHYP
jgi:peptidoglycan L-alanyl-D-glutamate endopeptidase CwlK